MGSYFEMREKMRSEYKSTKTSVKRTSSGKTNSSNFLKKRERLLSKYGDDAVKSQNTDTTTSNPVTEWLTSVQDLGKSASSYYGSDGYVAPDTSYETKVDQYLSKVASVRKDVASNKSNYSDPDKALSSVDEAENYLKQLKENIKAANKHYAQFSDEKAYNAWKHDTDNETKFGSMSSSEIEAERSKWKSSDKDIVQELMLSNMPYNLEYAEQDGKDMVLYDEVEQKRKYISEKYGITFTESSYENSKLLTDLYNTGNVDTTGGDVAYTTSDGQNVTWDNLYKNAVLKEDFEARMAQYSKNADWDELSEKVKHREDTNSDYQIVSDLLRSTVPHDWDTAQSNGIDRATYEREATRREYISKKYGIDLSYANYEALDELAASLSTEDGANGNFDLINAMTEEEKKVLSYIYQTEGRQAALDWHNDRLGLYQKRSNAILADQLAQVGKDHKFWASVGSTALTLASGVEFIADTVDHAVTGKEQYNTTALAGSSIRAGVMEDVNWEIDNWDAFDFIYSTGMSMADSAAAMATGGTLGGIMNFSRAAAQGTNDALDRGLSNKDAFWAGLMSGVFECAFESISIGNFNSLKDIPSSSFKEIAKNIGKSMLVNASEETATEIANIAYDAIANGDLSQFETRVRQLVANGVDESEARSTATWEFLGQVGEAGASGALMGLGFGVLGNTGNAIRGVENAKRNNALSKGTMSAPGGVDALRDVSAKAAENASQGLKDKLTKRSDKVGAKATQRNVASLYSALNKAYAEQDKAEIMEHLRKGNLSEKAAGYIADALVSYQNGELLTDWQMDLLKNNMSDQGVMDAMTKVLSNKDSGMAQRRSELYGIAQKASVGLVMSDLDKQATKAEKAEVKKVTKDGFAQDESGNKYVVADEGKNINTKTNQSIGELKVQSVEKGRITFEADGQTVEAKDVSFTTDDAVLYAAISDLGSIVDADTANSLVDRFHKTKGMSSVTYANGMAQAYRYGYYGFDFSELKNPFAAASKLSEDQQEVAFAMGRANRKTDVKKNREHWAKTKKVADLKKTGKGGVYFRSNDNRAMDFDEYMKSSNEALKDVQASAIESMKIMSKALGIQFFVYESYVKDGVRYYVDEKGKERKKAPNGFYTNGAVYIDLHAGNTGKGTMLFTLAHELTHYIKDKSPSKFNTLADIVFRQSGMKGSVSAYVAQQMEKAKKNGSPIFYADAVEETVADAMESILTSGRVVEMLAEVGQKDKSLKDTIVEWFMNTLSKLKDALKSYAGISPETAEGRAIAQSKELVTELEKVFAEGLVEASENAQKENTTDEGGVKMQARSVNGSQVVWIENSGFTNAQLQDPNTIAQYIASHIGEVYRIIESGQSVYIGKDLPGEFTHSKYTSYLQSKKPALLKAKNKAASSLGEMIEIATNRRWETTKHKAAKDAKYGMYRYDTKFAFPIRDQGGNVVTVRAYDAELLIRNASDGKKYLYDIVNIKENTANAIDLRHKEARKGSYKTATQGDASKNSIRNTEANVNKNSTRQIDMPQFKQWFGDSKVVNSDGTPKVVYHGTIGDFNIFNGGAFFTDDYFNADGYASGERVVEAYLKIERPLIIDCKGKKWDQISSIYGKSTQEVINRADRNKYDGVIFENINDSWTDDEDYGDIETVYYPFQNTQIKSATDNIGTFDESNPDIRYSTRDYKEQVEAVKNNTHDPNNHVYMGTTPTGIVNILELPKLPMLITSQHIYSMAVSERQSKAEGRYNSRMNYHDLGWDTVKKLPEYINKPVMIIKANTDKDDATFVVVTGQTDKDGSPVIAAVKPNGRGKFFNIEFPTNIMLSGYGKNSIQGYVARAKTENRILYANKYSQKNKANPSVQFADILLSSDYTTNLAKFKQIVNSKFVGTIFENSRLPKNSMRDPDALSNRELLVDALSSVAITPEEKSRLKEYQNHSNLLDRFDAELQSINAQLKELSFAPGKRDMPKIRELKARAMKLTDYLNKGDATLLRLEGTRELKPLLARLRKNVDAEAAKKREAALIEKTARDEARLEAVRQSHAEDRKQVLNGHHTKHPSATDSVGAAASGFDPISHLQYEYGTIPEGENPVRDDSLPVSTDGNNRVSRTARTVKGAKVTPDEFVDLLDKEVAEGGLSYLPVSNDETTQKAMRYIQNYGWDAARYQWSADVRSGKVSAELSAVGALLLNNAANSGDSELWLDILHDYQIMGTSAGQAIQALRILKKLDPDSGLYMIKRSVQQMVEDMHLDTEITVDSELEQEYLNAETDADRDEVLDKITKDVAQQIPSTALDWWTALRYLNMLGNLRTQVRNITGNIGMKAVSSVKNAIAAGLEKLVYLASDGKFERTKVFAVSREMLKAAREDFGLVESVIQGGGKYSDTAAASTAFAQKVQDQRTIFKVGSKKIVPLEGYRKLTNWAMETGDLVFSKSAYARSLAGYLAAHGVEDIDLSKVDLALMDKARLYAVKEAQEQTFRDTNVLSNWISKVGRRRDTPKAAKIISEGVMPFRKTPANVLIRAEEYSPLGVINSVVTSIRAMQKGSEVTGAQVINSWAKSLTGTGLFGLGMLLGNLGILIGGKDDDDDEEKFESMNGWQNYALVLPDGTNLTIDFLSPSAMPMFMGAQLMKQLQEGNLGVKEIETALLSIADPMIQMSMLQGVNDTLENIQYAEDNLGQFLINAGTSYLTQGLTNTLVGQLERSFEDNRMSTYVDKDSVMPEWMQRQLGKVSAKTIGWDFGQIPYINAWGEEEKNPSLLANMAYNMLSPSYVNKGEEDEVSQELYRLNNIQSDVNVFPRSTAKTISFVDKDGVTHEDYNLSAEEYVALAKKQGQTQRQIVEKMISSNLYDSLPDNYKAKAITAAYDYAREHAQIEVLDRNGFSSDWMEEIKGNVAECILSHVIEVNIKGMFLSGDITAAEAVNRRVKYCGDTVDAASEKIAYWNFQDTYPDYDWDQSAVTKYYDYAKPAGISIDLYNQFRTQSKGITKRNDVLRVIDSLSLSVAQKDALYYAKGYKESTLSNAPWH